MKFINKLFLASSVIALGFFATGCNKDSNSSGSAQIEITDAPIDDASVKSTFVTIADIKVDGTSISGFTKTTIDLMAYQNGVTKVLANAKLNAKTYSNITLVLDFNADQSGTGPGCYVLDVNGVKHKLTATSNEITVAANMAVSAAATSTYVIDFDLRKCIRREAATNDNYEFVTNAELNAGVRVVNKGTVATVKGNVSDAVSGSSKVVVYAYKKGTYVRSTEVSGQGSSSIEFAKATTSANVDASGNYQLSFLESGNYEVVYASYKTNTTTGKMELKGTLVVSSLTSIVLDSISLGANANVTVNVAATAVLPI